MRKKRSNSLEYLLGKQCHCNGKSIAQKRQLFFQLQLYRQTSTRPLAIRIQSLVLGLFCVGFSCVGFMCFIPPHLIRNNNNNNNSSIKGSL